MSDKEKECCPHKCSVEIKNKYIENERWDIVERAINVLVTNIHKKMFEHESSWRLVFDPYSDKFQQHINIKNIEVKKTLEHQPECMLIIEVDFETHMR